MNWFLKVITTHYFDFSGRARRKEFWMFSLISGLINLLANLVFAAAGLPLFGSIVGLIFFMPALGVTARRLHDLGKSGWLMLLAIVPFVGFYLIYLLTLEGEQGANAYGLNPKMIGE